MKLAVTGKGGVGKTTFSSLLVRYLSDQNKKVLAIDADPDANFASSLGLFDSNIPNIADMKGLIRERTGVSDDKVAGFFKLNPKVDDIVNNYSVTKKNIKLIKIGTIKRGGGGCLCPESTLIKSLMSHIVITRNEWVVMDMEAGIEHLGRATAKFVDKFIVVVEPGLRSIETAKTISKLAFEIGIKEIFIVGNKIRNDKDKKFLIENLSNFNLLSFIEYDEKFIEADLSNKSPYDLNLNLDNIMASIIDRLSEVDLKV